MKIKIKKLDEKATIPTYGKPGDAGMDLVATSIHFNSEHGYFEFGTGLAVEIPVGFVGLIFPRSSVSKSTMTFANCVGVIDSGYRGEIKLRFFANVERLVTHLTEAEILSPRPMGESLNKDYLVGDRVGQLIIMPIPTVEFEEVEELSDTERGAGGFGSTGN